MPLISSILVGTANGCSKDGYVASNKKLTTMDASDLTRIRKLQAIGRSTPVASLNTSHQNGGSYPELYAAQYASRVSVPLCAERF